MRSATSRCLTRRLYVVCLSLCFCAVSVVSCFAANQAAASQVGVVLWRSLVVREYVCSVGVAGGTGVADSGQRVGWELVVAVSACGRVQFFGAWRSSAGPHSQAVTLRALCMLCSSGCT